LPSGGFPSGVRQASIDPGGSLGESEEGGGGGWNGSKLTC
jgi:hypothetical protein